MKKITTKNIFSNLLKVIFIILFVILFSQIFGSINTLTGISILVALMTFWCIDIGINKKQALFIIVLLFLLTGISNRLAMFNKSKYASVHILTLGYNSPRLAA